MERDRSHGRAPGHYFEPKPSAPPHRREIELVLPDRTFRLTTDAGVFSARGVDPGTRLLLLEGARPPTTGTIVDLGCGYGPIALTLAARAPGATVWAVDVNERALELCTANAARAGLSNVRIGPPPPTLEIDALFSNPPIRLGKAALHALLNEWLGRLAARGTAQLVVQRHLGADSLATWLRDEGWNVERKASRAGYRLLEVNR